MIFMEWDTMINGQVIELSRMENIMLNLIIENKEKVTTYQEICFRVFAKQMEKSEYDSIIHVMLSLRKKLKGVLDIFSIRGRGYCLYEYW